jgi:hypothetical protein
MFEDNDSILLANFQEAYESLETVPFHVKAKNGGKGWPVSYSLLPIETLDILLGVQTHPVRSINNPAPDILNSAIRFFDDYLGCEHTLDDYQTVILANEQYLPQDARHALKDRLSKLQIAKQRFSTDFRRVMSSIKAGNMNPGVLCQVIDQYQRGGLPPDQIRDLSMPGRDVLNLVHAPVAAGAVYIGHNGAKLEDVLPNHIEVKHMCSTSA